MRELIAAPMKEDERIELLPDGSAHQRYKASAAIAEKICERLEPEFAAIADFQRKNLKAEGGS